MPLSPKPSPLHFFLAREYVAHYNHERPHQGIGNVLIRAPPQSLCLD